MIRDYYYGKVLWAPREKKGEQSGADLKVALQTPEGTEEVFVEVDSLEEVADVEKHDIVTVVADYYDDDIYYDLALPAYPEEARKREEAESVQRLSELYNQFQDEGVTDPSAAQKMAVTVFLHH